MHELSIAMSIVELAEEEAARHSNARVESIHIKVGRLSGVVSEALQSCFEIACEGTSIEGCKLLISDVPVLVYCTKCEARHAVNQMDWSSCPECGTPTANIVQGRELEIDALEIAETVV
jgi:hydrogenase nickel incorporation protein HypA/HybF